MGQRQIDRMFLLVLITRCTRLPVFMVFHFSWNSSFFCSLLSLRICARGLDEATAFPSLSFLFDFIISKVSQSWSSELRQIIFSSTSTHFDFFYFVFGDEFHAPDSLLHRVRGVNILLLQLRWKDGLHVPSQDGLPLEHLLLPALCIWFYSLLLF